MTTYLVVQADQSEVAIEADSVSSNGSGRAQFFVDGEVVAEFVGHQSFRKA